MVMICRFLQQYDHSDEAAYDQNYKEPLAGVLICKLLDQINNRSVITPRYSHIRTWKQLREANNNFEERPDLKS